MNRKGFVSRQGALYMAMRRLVEAANSNLGDAAQLVAKSSAPSLSTHLPARM